MSRFKGDRGALRIALTYAAVAASWIVISDSIPVILEKEPFSLAAYAMAKGLFFIAVTGALLYFLVARFARGLERTRIDHLLLDERYHLLFARATDPLLLFDASAGLGQTRLAEANEAACALLGQSPDDLLGMSLFALENGGMESSIRDGLERDGKFLVDTTLRGRDGRPVPVELSLRLVKPGDSPLLLVSARDISDRRALEALLERERERFLVTLRSIGDGVISTDTGGRVLLMNPAAERLTGVSFEGAPGEKPVTEVFLLAHDGGGPRLAEALRRAIDDGRGTTLGEGTILLSVHGTRSPIVGRIAPVRDRESQVLGVVFVFREFGQRPDLGEEVLQAAKFESISLLAGGVAHDFNNILTAALGNIGLAKMNADPGSRVGEKLHEAEVSLDRARELTNQLLTYARGGPAVLKKTPLGPLVSGACSLALSGAKSRCEVVLPPDLWEVEGDPDQISRALSALLLHADRSMPEGGTIRVKAVNLPADMTPSSLPRGPGVAIRVADKGPSPSPEALSRIFDPYVPGQKKEGALGLALAFSIVRRHHGLLTAQAGEDGGTILTMFLPAFPPEPQKAEKDSIAGAGRRILVMDGEPDILRVTGEILATMGFECSLASSGREAHSLYREALLARKPFAAVILDLTVAGEMGGEEAVKKLLEEDPQVKALVSSGYAGSPAVVNFRQAGFAGAVVKPYTARDLARALARIL